MTYILSSEDRRKLEEALELGSSFARSDGAFDAADYLAAALSLLAGLPKVPDADARQLLKDLIEAKTLKEKHHGGDLSLWLPKWTDAWRAARAAMKEHPQT